MPDRQRHSPHDTVLGAGRLALEEALLNALKHGNRLDPVKTVTVTCEISEQQVEISVEEGFDPDSLPDPNDTEQIEADSGRGILLMRSFMTWVRYNE